MISKQEQNQKLTLNCSPLFSIKKKKGGAQKGSDWVNKEREQRGPKGIEYMRLKVREDLES